MECVAERTGGFSGADIATLNRDANYEPLRKLEKSKYFKKVIDNNSEKYVPCEKKEKNSVELNYK